MTSKTPAIVLNTLKYSDNSLIVTLYTLAFGRIAIIVNTGTTRKSKFRANTFHPLALLQCEIDHRSKREVQRAKEIFANPPLVSIATEFTKSTISVFIAEVLYKTIKEEHSSPELFHFLETTVLILEHLQNGISIFHLSFLCQYIKYLGFYPQLNYSTQNKYFDLVQSKFVPEQVNHSTLTDEKLAYLLKQMFTLSYTETSLLIMNRQTKFELLEILVQYLHLHLDKTGIIQSHQILKQVFDTDEN